MADIHKLPEEQFYITGNFVSVLRGDILDTDQCSVSAVDRNGSTSTNTVLEPSTLTIVGGTLRVRVRGGTFASSPYTIKLIAETITGNTWVIPITLHIDED